MSGKKLVKTIVDLDLVEYSTKVALSATTGPLVDKEVRRKMGELIKAGTKCATPENVEPRGDGALYQFADAASAHCFATAIHEACVKENRLKPTAIAEFWFRIGIATGEIQRDADGLAGFPMTNAARLQGAARAGEILICESTYSRLPDEFKKKYSSAERLTTKHKSERFVGRRYGVARPASPKIGRNLIKLPLVTIAIGIVMVAAVYGVTRLTGNGAAVRKNGQDAAADVDVADQMKTPASERQEVVAIPSKQDNIEQVGLFTNHPDNLFSTDQAFQINLHNRLDVPIYVELLHIDRSGKIKRIYSPNSEPMVAGKTTTLVEGVTGGQVGEESFILYFAKESFIPSDIVRGESSSVGQSSDQHIQNSKTVQQRQLTFTTVE